MIFRRILQGALAILLLGLAGLGAMVWMNWSLVKSMTTAKSRGVEILDGYAPLASLAGASPAVSLARKDPQTALVAGSADQMAALDGAFAYSKTHDGLAMAVWHRGQIIREDYTPPYNSTSRFETFSMHKSVMGLLYGAAIRDGVIGSIDDPIGRYVSEWANDKRGAIPLRQFMSMSSGLKFYSLNKRDWPALQLVMSDQVSKTALSIPADGMPGERFEYYNVNSQLAGIALDRALRQSGKGGYAAYLSTALWQKIGAADANLWIEHEGGDPRFFSGLQASTEDWVKVGALIANGGRVGDDQVIPADWIAQMTAPSALNPNYGMQIWRGSPWQALRSYGANTPFKVPHSAAYLVDDLVFFDGFGGERVYISPKLQLVIVRVGRARLDFDDSAIPNGVIAGLGLNP